MCINTSRRCRKWSHVHRGARSESCRTEKKLWWSCSRRQMPLRISTKNLPTIKKRVESCRKMHKHLEQVSELSIDWMQKELVEWDIDQMSVSAAGHWLTDQGEGRTGWKRHWGCSEEDWHLLNLNPRRAEREHSTEAILITSAGNVSELMKDKTDSSKEALLPRIG